MEDEFEDEEDGSQDDQDGEGQPPMNPFEMFMLEIAKGRLPQRLPGQQPVPVPFPPSSSSPSSSMAVPQPSSPFLRFPGHMMSAPPGMGEAPPRINPADLFGTAREQQQTVFACPFCSERMNTDELAQHLPQRHSGESPHVVCPVCAAAPGGDPEYRSANIFEHFAAQHSSASQIARLYEMMRSA